MLRAARHKGHTFAMVMGSRASPSSVRRSGIVNFDLLFNIIDDLDNQLNLLLEANAPRTDGKTGRVDPDWPASTPSSAQLQERRRHQGNDYNKSGDLDFTIHKTLDGDKKTWRRHSAACSEQPGNNEGNAMRKTPAGNCNTNKGTPSETGTPRETGTPINSMTPRRRLSCNTTLTMESESSCTRRQHQHIPSVAFTAAIHPEMSTPAINGSSDRKWSIPSPKKLPTGCTQALRHLFMPPTCSSTPPTLSIIPSDMHAPQTTISGPIDIDGSLELNRSIQGYKMHPTASSLPKESSLHPPHAVQQPMAAANKILVLLSTKPTYNTSIPPSIPNSYTASTDFVHTVHLLQHSSHTLQPVDQHFYKDFVSSGITPTPDTIIPTGQCNGPGIFSPGHHTSLQLILCTPCILPSIIPSFLSPFTMYQYQRCLLTPFFTPDTDPTSHLPYPTRAPTFTLSNTN